MSAPLVKLRSGDGMRTLTLIGNSYSGKSKIYYFKYKRSSSRCRAFDAGAADVALLLQQLLEVGQLLGLVEGVGAGRPVRLPGRATGPDPDIVAGASLRPQPEHHFGGRRILPWIAGAGIGPRGGV